MSFVTKTKNLPQKPPSLPSCVSDSVEIKPDPEASAKAAGLRYVHDDGPGIRRKKAGRNFSYLDPDGHPMRDKQTLARINALAIPPAYRDVWICPFDNGHIQATGFDERGRKQYRYHAKWREARDETKYTRMMQFGAALPAIRARVAHDLAKPGLSREKVLATLVQLLEKTAIRVGNEEYARQNKSYGLTTMRNKHVAVEGTKLHFEFKGKSGVQHHIDLQDRKIARILAKLQDLPGQELFQYVDGAGTRHSIGSSDVNQYLHEISGQDFTAKDFRTWTGTILASLALQELQAFDSETAAKKNVLAAIKSVSQRLGNTPSVCRKCYVHPAVLESYLDGTMLESLKQQAEQEMQQDGAKLQPEEAAVLGLLQARLARETV